MDVDVTVQNEGSIVLLWPQTEAAADWCTDHLPEDCLMFGNSYVVEHRYAGDVVTGMLADGLVVE